MTMTIALDPVLARIGPLQLGWHGVLTALAVIVAVQIGVAGAKRRGYPEDGVSRVALWGVLGGLVGARLFHVLDHLPQYLADPLSILAVWEGGIAVYGGFVGGILAGWLAARRAGLASLPLLDAAAPAMLVGQLIGRLGCLVNGDAWGAPTGAGWGLVYSHPGAFLPPELLGVPTQPYPLYEIVAVALVLVALLIIERRRAPRPGDAFVTAVLGYAAVRYVLTSFRQEEVVFAGLQEAQLVALLTASLAIAFALAVRPRRAASSSVT